MRVVSVLLRVQKTRHHLSKGIIRNITDRRIVVEELTCSASNKARAALADSMSEIASRARDSSIWRCHLAVRTAETSKLGTRSWVVARKPGLDNLTDVMNGPGDEVEQLLVNRQAGPRPAPAGAVEGDQDGVAREPFERSKDYERVRFKN